MKHDTTYCPKWNKNPIESTKNCNILLHNGYTLQNSTGGQVTLSETGQQIVVQTHKSQKHNKKEVLCFSNPQCWFVVGESGISYKVKVTLMMKFWYFISNTML